MEHFISMYIDNELTLEEKILFVRKIHDDPAYYTVALNLLDQERELDRLLNVPVPELVAPKVSRRKWRGHAGWAMAAMVLLAFGFMLGSVGREGGEVGETIATASSRNTIHRFVIQQKESTQVEIAGNFTNWQRLPLQPTGRDGYWEISLSLPSGEHHYSFIVDGNSTVPDPTVPEREVDDFGSVNSILHIGKYDGRS